MSEFDFPASRRRGGVGVRRIPLGCAAGDARRDLWWPERAAGNGVLRPCSTAHEPPQALKRVVVVDDDPDICEMLGYILAEAGFAVELAADGEQGLAAVRRLRPALVVLDWTMPGVSGIEVCRMLRADPATAEIRILIVSARAEASDREESRSAGADDHLVKPFVRRELVRRVRALVKE